MQINSTFVRSIFATSLLLGLNSCTKISEPEPSQPYDAGIFVLNRGNFSDNNGSITLINPTTKTVSYDIFQKENNRAISGGISDYVDMDGKGIILVDNATSGKDLIEIVNARTFKSIATIPSIELENPRYVVKAGTNKAYATCWDSFNADYSYKIGYVTVIDLITNKITKKIPVQRGAEKLILVGTDVIVGSVGGDNTISIINTATDAVSQIIEIGKNPRLIGLDANGKLWFYAGSEFVKYNVTSKAVEGRVKITTSNAAKSPSNFTFSKDKSSIMYVYSFYDAADGYKQKGETFSFGINDATITTIKPFINKLFTGLATDPATGNIYAGFTPSYKQAGYIFRYQTNGTLIDSLKAEIAPEGFLFK
jgi:YVTN family beta-propeller protein